MGGLGSGLYQRERRKLTTEKVRQVDVRFLKRMGTLDRVGYRGKLSWSRHGQPEGWIEYSVREDSIVLDYKTRVKGMPWTHVTEEVFLDRTPCNFGGERKWFKCPDCNRRVAVLYGVGPMFFCRHCYGLPHTSKCEDRIDRLVRLREKISRRLRPDGDAGLSRGRPKGMHRKTYERLRREEVEAFIAAEMAIDRRIEKYDRLSLF